MLGFFNIFLFGLGLDLNWARTRVRIMVDRSRRDDRTYSILRVSVAAASSRIDSIRAGIAALLASVQVRRERPLPEHVTPLIQMQPVIDEHISGIAVIVK